MPPFVVHVEGLGDLEFDSAEQAKPILADYYKNQGASPSVQAPEQSPISAITQEATKRLGERKVNTGGAERFIGTMLQSIANTGSFGSIPYLTGTAETLSGTEVPGSKGMLDTLSKNIDVEKQVQEMRGKENPTANAIGSIIALLSPGGAAGVAAQAGKAIRGASIPSKIAALLAEGGIQGAAGQMGINPNSTALEVAGGAGGGSLLNSLFGGFGAGVKKTGEFFLDKALGKGSEGLGKTIVEKFGPSTATSLAKKSSAELGKIGENLDTFYKENAASLVKLPKNITFGDIKNKAMDYLMSGHDDIASQLDEIGTIAKNNGNMIPPESAQFLKGIMGKEAYQESGLRQTIKASGIGKQIKSLVDNLKGALGEGEASKLQGLWDEFSTQKGIQNRLKPNKFSEGFSPKVGQNLSPLELFASLIEPGAAPAILGYKALKTIPVASAVGAAGKNIPKIEPALIPLLNLLVDAGLVQSPGGTQ